MKPAAAHILETIAGLETFHGRRPDTPVSDLNNTFATLAQTDKVGVYAGSFDGESAWERHRNGDELVNVLRGQTHLTILTDDGPTELDMKAGMVTIVPQGCWHKFRAPGGVTVMTMTAGPTDHFAGETPAD